MPGITLDAVNYKGNIKTSAEMLTGSVKTLDTIKETHVVKDLVERFIDAEIALVSDYHNVRQPIVDSQSFADAYDLDTFPQCMGQVVKQNLVATTKRVGVGLIRAVNG